MKQKEPQITNEYKQLNRLKISKAFQISMSRKTIANKNL